MEFHFSLRSALKESWALFKKHWALFLVLSLVLFLLQLTSRSKHVHYALMLIISIASLLWSFVYLKITLAILDGAHPKLSLDTIQKHLPTIKNVLNMIGVAFLMAAIIICGFILLIIPGFYFMIRLCFSNFSYIDHQKGIVASLKHSWQITKGDAVWTIILAILILILIMIAGTLLFGVGLLVAYPVGFIFFTKLYRALEKRHNPIFQHKEELKEAKYE